jgi:hypothetical protein
MHKYQHFDNYLSTGGNRVANTVMTDIRFNLRNKKAKGKTMIMLSLSYSSYRLRMTTGRSVMVKDWNFRKQRVFERETIEDALAINLHLSFLAYVVGVQMEAFVKKGIIPTPEVLKNKILQTKEKSSPDRKSFFWETFDSFLAEKKGQIDDIVDYDKALRKHLLQAEKIFGDELTLEDFSSRKPEFIEVFQKYLTYEALNIQGIHGLSVNTVGKQYKNLKVFLNWCFDKEVIDPFSLKHLINHTEEIDSVFLKEKELDLLEKMALEGEQKKVRDLFLVGCETGLRFSDFSTLPIISPSDAYLEVSPKKTQMAGKSNKVLIPISDRFKRILEEYNYTLPNLTNSYLGQFNKIIRALCYRAGLNELITTQRSVSGEQVSIAKYKWEMVSSHTCRRTFCTLKFLAGMPAHAIMKFSGHKTEKNFMRYLRLDAQLNAEEFKSFF